MLTRVIKYALLVISVFSNAQQQEKGFVIRGHIDGIENNTWIYLYNIDEDLTIDSAKAVNGNFILSGNVKQPITCWLKCLNEYAIIQVENTEITFNAPLENMFLYHKTTGGREQLLRNQLASLQFPFDKIYLGAYDSIMNKKYKDADDRKRLVGIFNEAQTRSQHIYIDFGLRHPASYIGLDILYRNRENILPDSLRLCYEQLSGDLKLSSKAEAIREYLSDNLVRKGGKLIDFTVETIDGRTFTLSSLKGNYILLNFWSVNCAPCRAENKEISRNYTKYDKKIQIVNFLVDKNKDAWLRASQADKILWTNVSDLQGNDGKIKTQYNVQAIPSSFLIGKDGIVIERFNGFDENLLRWLEKLQ